VRGYRPFAVNEYFSQERTSFGTNHTYSARRIFDATSPL